MKNLILIGDKLQLLKHVKSLFQSEIMKNQLMIETSWLNFMIENSDYSIPFLKEAVKFKEKCDVLWS